jgi:hypothetical protein
VLAFAVIATVAAVLVALVLVARRCRPAGQRVRGAVLRRSGGRKCKAAHFTGR